MHQCPTRIPSHDPCLCVRETRAQLFEREQIEQIAAITMASLYASCAPNKYSVTVTVTVTNAMAYPECNLFRIYAADIASMDNG
jgi:hypothetical protein